MPTNTSIQRICERIRAARLMAGMSQQQVADAVGVSKMSISKWERGLVKLTSGHLLKLGRVLGRKVEYFIRPIQVKVIPATYSPHCSNRRWIQPESEPEEPKLQRVVCPDCSADIPADGNCWYCENSE